MPPSNTSSLGNPWFYVNSDLIGMKVARRNPPIYLFLKPNPVLLKNPPPEQAGRSLVKHSKALAIRSLISLAEKTWLALFQSLATSQIKHLPCINICLIWSNFQTAFVHRHPSSRTVLLFTVPNHWFYLLTAHASANQPDLLHRGGNSPMNWSDAARLWL